MAKPNLAASALTVNIDTAILNPTNTMTDLIAAVATDHAITVDAVFACNIHASERGWITLVYKTGGTEYAIQKEYEGIAPGQMHNLLLGKPFYLDEGDSLRVQANQSSNFTVTAPYSDIVD
jgi:hypothetical protein